MAKGLETEAERIWEDAQEVTLMDRGYTPVQKARCKHLKDGAEETVSTTKFWMWSRWSRRPWPGVVREFQEGI